MARPVRKITDECHFTYIGLFSCGKEGGEDISGKMLLIENWLKKGESYVFFRRQSFWLQRSCCKKKVFLLLRLLLR